MTRLRRVLQEHSTKPVFGAALYFKDLVFIEVCAHLGFQVMRIEMEHAHITFAEAVNLCRISQGLRIANDDPHSECKQGMFSRLRNAAQTLLTCHGELGPRAARIDEVCAVCPRRRARIFQRVACIEVRDCSGRSSEQQKLNDELCLMAQVETTQAVANREVICSVPGVDIFIGPSDLAASLGVPGQTGHGRVEEAAQLAIKAAKRYGKLVAVGAQPADFKLWVKAGVDILFCTNDTSCLRIGAETVLQRARDAVSQAAEEAFTAK